jgi:hypothetical protein
VIWWYQSQKEIPDRQKVEFLDSFISAARTGITKQVNVVKYRTLIAGGAVPFERLYNQVLVWPVLMDGWWGIPGDSGSPLWNPPAVGQAKIHALLSRRVVINGVWFLVASPVSGVEREFPGWRIWHR